MTKISPVGWFIDKKTFKYYLYLIDRAGLLNRQTQFKNEIRKTFENKMFGDNDDHSEYYLTMPELDEIFKKIDKTYEQK